MAKIWKKLGLIILIILCLINIIGKLSTKVTLSDELKISSKHFSLMKNEDVKEKQLNSSDTNNNSVSNQNMSVENKKASTNVFFNEKKKSEVVEITSENSMSNSNSNEIEVIISE